MKPRFFMILLGGMLLMPVVGRAIVPTADVPGTIQAATEVGNTLNNVKESATQVTQYQKTMAAIGTAKKSVSEFITKQKEKIQEKLEKVEKYKQRVEEYKEKALAYKAEAEARINQVKSEVEGAINDVKEAKAEVEGAVNDVKSQVETAVDQVQDAKNQIEGAINQAEDIKNQVTETAGQLQPSDGAAVQAQAAVPASDGAQISAGTADAIVDMPTAMPSRRPITGSGISASASVPASAVKMSAPASSAVSGAAIAASAAVPAASAPAVMPAARQAVSPAIGQKASVAAVQKVSNAVSPANYAAGSVLSSVQDGKQPVMSVAAEGDALSDKTLKTSVAAETVQEGGAAAVQKTTPLLTANPVSAVETVGAKKASAAVKVPAAQSAGIKTMSPAKEADGISPAAKMVPSRAEPAVRRPTRATFKTSFGYGTVRTSYPLAFASLTDSVGGKKGGVTEDNMLIVSDSVAMYCNIDYEDAAEEGVYDKCLRQINDVALSEINDEVTKQDNENARKDLHNGMVEYMAAAFFEALDVYNESMTFKNNVVDPILTSDAPDVQSAWKYAVEMSKTMGTRVNALNKLWSRSLGIKAYSLYANEGLKTPESSK